MLFLHIVALSSVAVAANHSLNLRQLECDPSEQPVKACGTSDLTASNWAAFNIDDFLVNFLFVFGSPDFFPGFFVDNQAVSGGNAGLDCSTPDASCVHPTSQNAAPETDCAFSIIPNVLSSVCNKYVSPQAAFVVQNWINLFQGTSNSFRGIEDAGNTIAASTFVNDIVDGLSEEQGNLLEAVFESIVSLVLGILPFGRAFQLGVNLFSGIDTILGLAGEESALTGPLGAISIAEANADIEDLAERTKDQLTRQVQEMVVGTKGQMQQVLDVVFGPTPSAIEGQERDSVVFQMAASGQFLGAVPSREELAASMEENLKHWIVSSTMTGMQWELLLSPRELFDDPADPGGVCRKGFKGIPKFMGAECALFRRVGEGENGVKPANPAILENLIDFQAAAENALECAGGTPNWETVLDGEVGAGGLPRCLYTFPVIQL